MSETTIYLIRHATPDWERKDIPYHLPPGPPLTEEGLTEAFSLGDFMRQEERLVLYTSPLERCSETARIVSQAVDAPLTVDDRLIEWQPEENPQEVRARMQRMLDFAVEQSLQGGNHPTAVGLVTHGGPIGVLLEQLGMEPAVLAAQRKFDHRNPLPPAAAWKASRKDREGPWLLDLVFIPDVTLV